MVRKRSAVGARGRWRRSLARARMGRVEVFTDHLIASAHFEVITLPRQLFLGQSHAAFWAHIDIALW